MLEKALERASTECAKNCGADSPAGGKPTTAAKPIKFPTMLACCRMSADDTRSYLGVSPVRTAADVESVSSTIAMENEAAAERRDAQ